MKINDIIKQLEKFKDKKSSAIIALCTEFLPYENIINLDQNNKKYPKYDRDIASWQIMTDIFLMKLASLEFLPYGSIFAGGTHKSISEHNTIEARKFGQLVGKTFSKIIPLSTGATSKFMEIINAGYVESGYYSIASTTNFPLDYGDKVNKYIKYCFTASTFANMEVFLIHNAIAGVFFDGGVGTTYEAASMFVERQRGTIDHNTPIIFIKHNTEDHLLYKLIKDMRNHGVVYESDLHNVYSVNNAQEAIDILLKYDFLNKKYDIQIEHEFIREIFKVSKNRYLN